MRHSDQIDQLIPALIVAQTGIEAVGKTAKNPHYKSLYMPFDAVLAAIKPHLAPNGLALVFSMENADDAGADVVTTVLHTSGQWAAVSLRMPFEKATAQGACTALTYGSRRGGAAMFAIVADPDDDGQLLETFPVQHAASKPAHPVVSRVLAATVPPKGTSAAASAAFARLVPFGKSKGIALGSLGLDELRSLASWCRDKDTEKFQSLIDACDLVAAAKEEFSEPPAALEEDSDQIPF